MHKRERTSKIAVLALLVVIALFGRLHNIGAAQEPESRLPLSERFRTPVHDLVLGLYEVRDDEPVWLTDDRTRNVALHLLAAAADSHRDGLCPVPADISALQERLQGRLPNGASALRALDVRTTAAIAAHLLQLGLGYDSLSKNGTLSARALDVAELLTEAVQADAGGVDDVMKQVTPRHTEYFRLRDALTDYRALSQSGTWPMLADDGLLRPGDEIDSEARATLVRRLRLTGDHEPPEQARAQRDPAGDTDTAELLYGGALVEAVRHFQARHGLAIDGIVGPATRRELNVTATERAQQIALNMDRWRRLPDDLGEMHVRVNIPALELEVVSNRAVILRMETVVGSHATQTPVFSDRIRYLDFNPYWNVPDSIAQSELAPREADEPGYLEGAGFEVLEDWDEDTEPMDPRAVDWEGERFRYRLRQQPGPDNALGQVKFMFPNRYNVYLHDTPATHLFGQPDRARSHGCVRVERPAALAEALLLNRSTWERHRIDRALDEDERHVVRLRTPVPVHLVYFTAWVDEDDVVQFRRDIYGRDARGMEALACATASR